MVDREPMVLVASKMRPNTALVLTPLCGPKIMAILKADIGSIAISVYGCGAAQRQAVEPVSSNVCCLAIWYDMRYAILASLVPTSSTST